MEIANKIALTTLLLLSKLWPDCHYSDEQVSYDTILFVKVTKQTSCCREAENHVAVMRERITGVERRIRVREAERNRPKQVLTSAWPCGETGPRCTLQGAAEEGGKSCVITTTSPNAHMTSPGVSGAGLLLSVFFLVCLWGGSVWKHIRPLILTGADGSLSSWEKTPGLCVCRKQSRPRSWFPDHSFPRTCYFLRMQECGFSK